VLVELLAQRRLVEGRDVEQPQRHLRLREHDHLVERRDEEALELLLDARDDDAGHVDGLGLARRRRRRLLGRGAGEQAQHRRRAQAAHRRAQRALPVGGRHG